MMKRLIIGLSLILWSGLFTGSAMAIEEHKYRVIETSGSFELRVYDPKIIAEVEIPGTLKQASGKGFRLIADYIFGNNISRSDSNSNEKISMTAPVTMQANTAQAEKINITTPVTIEQKDQKWLMHFIMPSQYTLATLPKPNNPAVIIRQVSGAKYAVIRFSGLAGKTKTDKQTVKLEKWMDSRNINAIGKPELARYNPPWTLPFMRRNEVMIRY